MRRRRTTTVVAITRLVRKRSLHPKRLHQLKEPAQSRESPHPRKGAAVILKRRNLRRKRTAVVIMRPARRKNLPLPRRNPLPKKPHLPGRPENQPGKQLTNQSPKTKNQKRITPRMRNRRSG